MGDLPATQAKTEAERLALNAIRLAPEDADGYAALGFARAYGPASLQPLERAVQLAPERADTRIWLARVHHQAGRFDEALAQYGAAYTIEPLWSNAVYNWVYALATRRRFEEADAVVRRFAFFARDRASVSWFRSIIAEKRGDLSETVRHAEAARAHAPDLSDNNERLAWSYSMLGFRDHAGAVLGRDADPLQQRILTGRRRAAMEMATGLGANFWDDISTAWRGAELLAAERAWPALARLYDARFPTPQALCTYAAGTWTGLGVTFVIALRESGRSTEAEAILGCTSSGVSAWVSSGDHPASAWFFQAQVAALQGNRGGALDALERAIAYGWRGENTSPDLRDYPALDSLASQARFRVAHARLRTVLDRERGELARSTR